MDFSDYDLIVAIPTDITALNAQKLSADNHRWAHRDGNIMIVDRSSIAWMEKID